MIVQLAAAGILPAVTLKVLPPAVAVVATPVQVPPTASGVAFTSPAGYVSVKLMPESACGPLLEIVKVSVEFVPGVTVAGAKAFAMVGCARTASVAVFDAGPAGKSAVVTPEVVLT